MPLEEQIQGLLYEEETDVDAIMSVIRSAIEPIVELAARQDSPSTEYYLRRERLIDGTYPNELDRALWAVKE
jgi:hypothetical protein